MKKTTLNFIYNFTYKLLLIVLPIITTPYVSQALGASQIGRYSYTYSIVTFCILIGTLGSQLYTQRGIAYNRNNKIDESRFFWEIVLIRCFLVSVVCVLLGIVAIGDVENRSLFVIEGIELLAAALDISWLFQGEEDFGKPVLRNIIVKLGSIVCIFQFVKTPQDLLKYALIKSLSVFLGNVFMWLYLRKYIVLVKIKDLDIKKHFIPMLKMFLPQIATELYSVLDKSMLNWLGHDYSENGYYEQAQKVMTMSLICASTINATFLPKVSNLFKNGKNKERMVVFEKALNLTILLAVPVSFGVFSVASNMVPWFFGEGYEKVIDILRIFAICILLTSISSALNQLYFVASNREGIYTLSTVSAAICNVLFNLFMIPKFHSIGAVIGSVVAEVVLLGVSLFFFYKDKTGVAIVRPLFKYVLMGGIMAGIIFVISGSLSATFLNTMLLVAIGAIIYFAELVVVKDKFVLLILERIKGLLK